MRVLKETMMATITTPARHLGLVLLGDRPRILMYHSIVHDGNPYARLAPGKYVEETVFQRSMEYVKRHYQPLSLEELVAGYRKRVWPRNAVVVTFDDGYANNFTRACPILHALGIPATYFVTTGLVDRTVTLWSNVVDRYVLERNSLMDVGVRNAAVPIAWVDRTRQEALRGWKHYLKRLSSEQRRSTLALFTIPAAPDAAVIDAQDALRWDQVRDLAGVAGMTVAPHTMTHPVLMDIDEAQARREIEGSLHRLKQQGVTVAPFFAYPYGEPEQFSSVHARILEELSFTCALSTIPGLVSSDASLYALPRYEGKNDINGFVRHVSGVQTLASNVRAIYGSC